MGEVMTFDQWVTRYHNAIAARDWDECEWLTDEYPEHMLRYRQERAR